MTTTGVILAGGKSSRYGGLPKGLERVAGVRIIDRVAAALRAVCGELLVIANESESAEWLPGVRTAGDVLPGQGSLGGLHAALAHAGTAVIVVAWDMPFVPEGLLHRLVARGADADVVAPESASRRGIEPLCAYYGPACRGPMERAIQRGDLRAIAFHAEIRLSVLPLNEVRAFGDPDELFMNVNSPEELAEASRIAARRAHSA